MRRLLETHPPGELAELVASNDESPSLAVDVAETRLRRNDAVEAAWFYRDADETAFTSW